MTERTGAEYLCQQISTVARQDAVALRKDLTIQQASRDRRTVWGTDVYFYVVNDITPGGRHPRGGCSRVFGQCSAIS